MQNVKPAAYGKKLAAMTADELGKECRQMIWLSAYAHNNPRSCYHWQGDLCHHECARREQPDIYDAAYQRVLAAAQ